MKTFITIIFFLISFFLFVVLSNTPNYPNDAIVLFLFTVGIYLAFLPRDSDDSEKKPTISDDDSSKFQKYIGTKIYHDTFFYDIAKIEKSPEFSEDKSYNIIAINEETKDNETFPVNIDEMSVDEYIKSKQKSLKY